MVGSQSGGEQVPPDPDGGEQDIGATVLLPPPLSTTDLCKTGGGDRDTTATNLDNKVWTQLKLSNFMPLLGRVDHLRGVGSTAGEKQGISLEEEQGYQGLTGADDSITAGILADSEEGSKTTFPLPVVCQEDMIVEEATPSMGEESELRSTKINEEDILVTSRGEGRQEQEEIDVKDCGDGDDGGVVKNDRGEKTMMSVKTTNGDAIVDMNVSQKCEFKRGRCLLHNIKGNKMQRKVKKWTKKRYGYGWVTSTIVEYTCQLGYSGYSESEDIQNYVRSSQSALTNSKGRNFNPGIPGLPIDGENGIK